jgi:putative hemolysin
MGLQETSLATAHRSAPNGLAVTVTRDPALVRAAQALRHEVFVREMGAAGGADGLERDAFDDAFEHVVLTDPARPWIGAVATTRIGRGENGYYAAREFDVAPLLASGRRVAEMGRTCLHPDYRGGGAAYALFRGMLHHLRISGVEVVFGTASLPGADPALHLPALRWLRARHLAPPGLRPRAVGPSAVNIAGEAPDHAASGVPPLLRAYVRQGAWVGEGAWVDEAFNTVDVCMVLDLARRASRPGGRCAL